MEHARAQLSSSQTLGATIAVTGRQRRTIVAAYAIGKQNLCIIEAQVREE
jgi:hypothetical protein